jgi:hypothetical protein
VKVWLAGFEPASPEKVSVATDGACKVQGVAVGVGVCPGGGVGVCPGGGVIPPVGVLQLLMMMHTLVVGVGEIDTTVGIEVG